MEHYFTNNQDLKSKIRDINFSYGKNNFCFKSDNGVFSKNKIDYASLFLVKTFLDNKNKEYNNILDIGCGYGFIGITLSKLVPLVVIVVLNTLDLISYSFNLFKTLIKN